MDSDEVREAAARLLDDCEKAGLFGFDYDAEGLRDLQAVATYARDAAAQVAALTVENERLQKIADAAQAYDSFILRHGVLYIESSPRLSAQRHMLHKDMHDALAAAPARPAPEGAGEAAGPRHGRCRGLDGHGRRRG